MTTKKGRRKIEGKFGASLAAVRGASFRLAAALPAITSALHELQTWHHIQEGDI